MPGLTSSSSEQPTKKPSPGRTGGAVDHDRRAFVGGAVDVGPDPVAVLGGDERAHHRGRVVAGADDHVGDAGGDGVDQRRRPMSPTATITEIAMHRSPAEP